MGMRWMWMKLMCEDLFSFFSSFQSVGWWVSLAGLRHRIPFLHVSHLVTCNAMHVERWCLHGFFHHLKTIN